MIYSHCQINNGIFADEHSACLILNNLIEKEEWKGERFGGPFNILSCIKRF